MKIPIGIAAILLSLGLSSAANNKDAPLQTQTGPKGEVSHELSGIMTPQQILSEIHRTNQMEIQAGRLAQQKGNSAYVKRFGQLLERDHRFSDKKINALAKDEKVQISELPLDSMGRETLQKLQNATGADFDREFLLAMRTGHEHAISMLQAAHKSKQDSDLNRFIGKLLPILNQHRELAGNTGKRT